jgi:predicted amidophosphoribosyltransferase
MLSVTNQDERTVRTMALANCSRCGALFVTQFEKHCKSCGEAILRDSHKVKAYIAAHPWASVMEVYHKTGVSLQTIYSLMERKQAVR